MRRALALRCRRSCSSSSSIVAAPRARAGRSLREALGVVDERHDATRRCRAASSKSAVPAIATLSDSPGLHRDRHQLVEREVGVEAVRFVAEHERGAGAEIDGLGRAAARARRRRPGASLRAERLEHLHCGNALHDPDRETRAGRGAYDLGIVGVDRSGPRPSTPAPAAAALRISVPALPGSREARTDDDERRTGENASMPTCGRRTTANTGCGVRVSPMRSAAPAGSETHRDRPASAPAPRGRTRRPSVRSTRSTRTVVERGRDDTRALGHELPVLLARRAVAQQRAQPRGPRRASRPARGGVGQLRRRREPRGGGDERTERRRLAHREVGEDLAVDVDLGGLQAGDEPRVRDVVLAARGVDAHDPQPPELALAGPAVAVRVPAASA